MPFISPEIQIREVDLTTSVPSVGSSVAAYVGDFNWGPVETPVFLDSETSMVRVFGKPTEDTATDFLTVSNFMAYGGQAWVVRAAGTGARNAVSPTRNINPNGKSLSTYDSGIYRTITNRDSFVDGGSISTVTANNIVEIGGTIAAVTSGNFDDANTIIFTATTNSEITSEFTTLADVDADDNYAVSIETDVGTIFRGIASITANSSAYDLELTETLDVTNDPEYGVKPTSTAPAVAASAAVTIFKFDDPIIDPIFVGKYPGALANSIRVYIADSSSNLEAEEIGNVTMNSIFPTQPDQSDFVRVRSNGSSTFKDEVHVAIVDRDGGISGIANTVIESFEGLSKASDAKNADGTTNYWKSVINNNSAYIFAPGNFYKVKSAHSSASTFGTSRGTFVEDSSGDLVRFNWGGTANDRINAGDAWDEISEGKVRKTAADGTFTDSNVVLMNVAGGTSADSTNKVTGLSLFQNEDTYNISFIIAPPVVSGSGADVSVKEAVKISNSRKDCITFYSPRRVDVVDNGSDTLSDVLGYKAEYSPSSYVITDCNWKLTYDRYNTNFVWIPLCGDMAGLCARTDSLAEPWYSPAGQRRGILLNVIRLAWNPTKGERDQLYAASINPVISKTNLGTLLFGDRTTLTRPSAFREIGVRRLFIMMELAIKQAAQGQMFEINDDFTRSQFKAYIEPYLRRIQAGRGIEDFLVICDESNNTSQRVNNNEFVADLFVKPTRSINFIQLNFVAVGSGIEFNEAIGAI